MALMFRDSAKFVYLYRGILQGMASLGGTAPNQVGYTAITVYGGTRPTAAAILASWPTYNSATSNLLAHFVSAGWNIPGVTLTTGSVMAMPYPPGNAIPLHTGTGTWAILWPTNISQASLANSTIPSTSFMVVDISDLAGTGVVKFNTLDFVTGVSHAVYSGSMYVSW
jgi:hypothetical protein